MPGRLKAPETKVIRGNSKMAYIDPTCHAIATQAANGKLTEQEILDAFAKIDARNRAMVAQGQLTGKAERLRKWAAEEGERAEIAAAMRARHAALNVLVRDRVDRQISGMVAAGLKPHQAIRAILEGINSPAAGSRASVNAAVQGFEARFKGAMLAELEHDRPHLAHMLADDKLDADVLTEMWELRDGGSPGSTKNDDAKYLARKFADYAELSRTDLNRLGASIGKLDGWAGVQMHDPIKMIEAGKAAWIGRITTLLDPARTFPDAPSATEVTDILGDIYDTIITGIPKTLTGAEMGQRVNPANLAKSLGASRVLHFQDAKAALSYRDQFGYGNTIAGMFAHLQHMAKLAGAMETLGPNPEVMFRSIAAGLQRAIRDSKLIADADKPKLIGKLNTEAGALKHAIDVTTGLVSRPVNVTAAKIGGDIRATQVMGKLGAVLASSISDVPTAAVAAQFRGSGFLNGLSDQLGGLMAGRPHGERAEISYLLGEGFDGLIGHITSQGLAVDGPLGVMGKLQAGFFKWAGQSWWTDVNRATSARMISAELGMRAGVDYAKLPPAFRHVLAQAGIDDKTWGVLGKVALRMDNGKPYLTPDRVREISDVDMLPLVADRIAGIKTKPGPARDAMIATMISDERRRLEVKMLGYVADQVSYGVIEADARTQRYTTGGQRAGTMAGEAMRFIMQFKGFPLGFITRPLARAIYGQRKDASGLERFAHIGQLVAGLTVAGYLAMTAKDMLKGYWPPRNPGDPRTILAAMQQGGALGIYGDFLFSKVNRFGGGITETALGPTIGTIGDLANVALDARDAAISGGQDKFSASQAFSTFLGTVPYANLHLVKPVLDYLILNSIRDALSPGTIQKQIRARRKEYGQDYLPAASGRPAFDPLNISRSF